MSDYLNLRLSDAQDGYEISYKGELLDFVPMKVLAVVKDYDRLMRERVEAQERRIRVRQFVNRLETLHEIDHLDGEHMADVEEDMKR